MTEKRKMLFGLKFLHELRLISPNAQNTLIIIFLLNKSFKTNKENEAYRYSFIDILILSI